ncbi:MAG: UDP-N-acetylmuramoyl-tripeptide--D-alanyl-D-alanine ligase [Hydrogenophilaceae bacterium]|nr:UDP-N-acetylmuramoyl-tripeptide--D-alanyl-D-alanine ligase [Hydrogenophilaceae bacterium]
MMRLSEAASAVDGTLTGEDREFTAVSTDSRSIHAGDLFVALKGVRFDGAAFASNAIVAGAAGVMINADADTTASPSIRVADSRIALGKLAAGWRKRFGIPVIAVTGSNGKTTVKEMLSAILRLASNDAEGVLATEGNLNNDIGCPMMMLKLRCRHHHAVLEMGMNHAGEIRYLTQLARPDVALVNNAQMAHIGHMGSVRAIAEAKGEIFEGLGAHGIAVINLDDPHAEYWRGLNAGRRILTFGFNRDADVCGEYSSNGRDNLVIHARERGSATVNLQVPGEHNARNALAATACAMAVGVDLQIAARALSDFAGVKGRLQRKPGLHGGRFIDDTYNANPDSTRAALAVLSREKGHKYFVLGDMGELGETAPALHAQVGLDARQAGVERLFGLGDLSKEAVRAFGQGGMHFERIEELLAEVENALAPDVTVLVKGSRAMRMERVLQSLSEGAH